MKPVVKEPVRAAMHQKLSNYETRPRQLDSPAWHLNGIIAKSSKNSKKIPLLPMPARFMGDGGPARHYFTKPLILT